MSNLGQILLDIQKESDGDLLQDTVEVRGKLFVLKLLNDKETNWTFKAVSVNNELSLALTARLAQLAVGIRSINGVKISELFNEQFEALPSDERIKLLASNNDDKALVIATLFMSWLSDLSPLIIGELYEKWQELSNRQMEARNQLKNSSGEALEEEKKKSSTEPSLNGDQ